MEIFLFSIIFLLSGYAFLIERNLLFVRRQIIPLANLKNNIADKKILLISDIHFNRWTAAWRVRRIYKKIKKEGPDILFITGDLIEDQKAIKKVGEFLRLVAPLCPVYIVFGNWDYRVLKYNMTELSGEIRQAGAVILENEVKAIRIGEEEINLIGLKDPFSSNDMEKDLQEAIGLLGGEKKVTILLAHSPEIIKCVKDKGIDLILSGHTHGGQVYLPLITKMIIPVSPKFKGYFKGYYRVGETGLYVNRGIGTSTLPIRFLAPPEITAITLEKNPDLR